MRFTAAVVVQQYNLEVARVVRVPVPVLGTQPIGSPVRAIMDPPVLKGTRS